jgi:hypothetical protein
MKTWKDDEGDNNIGLQAGHLTVFATEQISGSYVVSFAVTSELSSLDFMDSLTGFGAFSTIKLIRPAVEQLISEIERRGKDWSVCCDKRRERLYSRYIPTTKIQIV